MVRPNEETLTVALKAIFSDTSGIAQVQIIRREPNICDATFPSEFITCRLNSEKVLEIFCKQGGNHQGNLYDKDVLVRQGGVTYEAEIYRKVLVPRNLSAITFYGAYDDEESNTTWLFVEHLQEGVHVSKVPTTINALGKAAYWIGNFHRICDASGSSPTFVKVYDADYYLKWPRRTAIFSKKLEDLYPWVQEVCTKSEKFVDLILHRPTLIHGDYYSDNILFRNGKIYPVDWGWAAIGAGEQDLAALLERRPSEVKEQCEQEYQAGRWPEGAPPDFFVTLDVARMYLLFRWLGDSPERTINKQNRWRFKNLHKVAKRLGLVKDTEL